MVGYYKNRHEKIGKKVSIINILKGIKNGKWENLIEKVKSTDDKEVQQIYKGELPCFIPAGTCTDAGKLAVNFDKHSGFCCLDLDEGLENIDDLREALEADPYCFSLFLSCSGNGLAFIAKIPASIDHHVMHYLWLCEYIKKKYGCYGSDSQKNLNRLRYVSHDPDLYLNEESKLCTETKIHHEKQFTWKMLGEMKVDHQDPDNPLGKWDWESEDGRYEFCKEKKEERDTYTEGNRNWYITKLCLYMNDWGVTKEFAHITLPNDFDLPEKELHNTIDSVYRGKPENFGSALLEYAPKPKMTASKGGGAKEEGEKVNKNDKAWKFAKAAKMINAKEVAYNLFTQDHDIKGEVVDQLQYNTIFIDIRSNLTIVKADYDLVFHSHNVRSYNPILQFIEANSHRKPKGAIEKWIECIESHTGMDRTDEFDPRYKVDFVTKWYVAMIAQALNDHVKFRNEWFLALLGRKHGTGKTRFLTEFTLPESLTRYSTSRPIGDTKEDDYKLLLAQFMILVDDELDGKGWKDMKNFKSIMSQKSLPIRRKYDRKNSLLIRRATLCGTGNEYEVLTEYANRRIIPIQVEGVDLAQLEQIDLDDVFMEAYWLYKEGFNWWFEEADRDRLMEASEGFRSPSMVGEYLLYWFDIPESESTTEIVLSTDILTFMREKYRGVNFTSKAIGQVMSERGHEKTTVGKKRLNAIKVSRLSRYITETSNLTSSWNANSGTIAPNPAVPDNPPF